MNLKFFLGGLLAVMAAPSLCAQVSFGDARKFNDGWKFALRDDSLYRSADYRSKNTK